MDLRSPPKSDKAVNGTLAKKCCVKGEKGSRSYGTMTIKSSRATEEMKKKSLGEIKIW